MKVAFIGLGNMGFPMAGHLAAGGHEVTVHNRTRPKAEAWTKQPGGGPAEPRTGAGGGDGRRVHPRCRARDGLQDRRPRIEQAHAPLASRQLPARAVARYRFRPAALARDAFPASKLPDGCRHLVVVGFVLGSAGIEGGWQNR